MLFGGLESLTIGWLPTFMLSAKNAKKRPTIVEIKKEERKETSLSSLLCVLCSITLCVESSMIPPSSEPTGSSNGVSGWTKDPDR
jgi:hypothetical protein